MNTLDEIEVKRKKDSYIFSALSCILPCIILGMFLFIGSIADDNLGLAGMSQKAEWALFFVLVSLIVLSFISSLVSFVRNENYKVLKWSGAMLNIMLIILFLSIFLFL